MTTAAHTGRPATRRGRQLSQIALTAAVTVALAVVTGVSAGLNLTQWLSYGLAVSLVLWVGGAVSGQILLARLLDRGTGEQVLDYLRQLLWIIPRVYVPLGFVAVACGLALVTHTGESYLQPRVLIPLALYVLTAIAGSAISAPGYLKLLRLADQHGPDHPAVRQRLQPLAWLNRIELALVVGVGFTLLASAI
ncbi:hypothetical protein [Micromonospora endolithica]|uniref:DUF1772 domain-containing protein n=1 Tax=Micromonospora endolithica TaxID=230091 RepID=A0A3A9ZJC6_9ACTN|nr:hypothetical protein [Micromonospora endolithica]RKN48440.1 hypothetical protein D7223_10605 [Micromonospora endolithica]TWJ24481.1 hypothetical protein JD76_04631 [Micromonospora endolithica]